MGGHSRIRLTLPDLVSAKSALRVKPGSMRRWRAVLVLEVDGDGVKVAGGVELDFFDCPAFHLSELYKPAMRKDAFDQGKRCRAGLPWFFGL